MDNSSNTVLTKIKCYSSQNHSLFQVFGSHVVILHKKLSRAMRNHVTIEIAASKTFENFVE